MTNYKLVIEYDGSNYHGFQAQPGLPTIEGKLVENLAMILQHEVKLSAAGRTDAGVNALNQVVSFFSSKEIEPDRLRQSLNGLLPDDIVVKEVEIVGPEFDARRSAKAREYKYYILNRRYPTAFGRKYWLIPYELSLMEMKRAGEMLVGRRDFRSFCRPRSASKGTTRNLMYFGCEKQGDYVVLTFVADSFLNQMVRIMVGTLVEVGLGKRDVEDIERLLEARDRTLAGLTAPACGLFLSRIIY